MHLKFRKPKKLYPPFEKAVKLAAIAGGGWNQPPL
jgi:hypothetical protein